MAECGKLTVELELVFGMELSEAVAVFGTEDNAQGFQIKEVTALGSAPVLPIGGEPTSADNAMEVIVVQDYLAPCVKDGGDAKFYSPLVAAKTQKRFTCRFKEQGVKGALILQDEGVEVMGQCEDHMEVGNLQEAFFLTLQPFHGGRSLALRAVPVAAGMRHDVVLLAIRAAIVMHAEHRSAATQQGIEGFPVMGTEPSHGRTAQRGGQHLGDCQTP